MQTQKPVLSSQRRSVWFSSYILRPPFSSTPESVVHFYRLSYMDTAQRFGFRCSCKTEDSTHYSPAAPSNYWIIKLLAQTRVSAIGVKQEIDSTSDPWVSQSAEKAYIKGQSTTEHSSILSECDLRLQNSVIIVALINLKALSFSMHSSTCGSQVTNLNILSQLDNKSTTAAFLRRS
uniref:Ovule protein n=1 Tax=Ascaris lumbricoides TaxID=6252 RepID=A0A0M3I649_ASCLU